VPTETQRQPTIVATLPKAELHLHLDGSIRPDTAVQLAARHGTKLTREEVLARYNYSNFAGFIETFKWITSFLRTPDDYALITRSLAEELLLQNVVYAEITLSVGVMLRRMQNVEANFEAIRDTANSVPFRNLRTAYIFDSARQFGADSAMEVARWAAKLQSKGVIAFGIGGDELAHPAVSFRAAFDYARQDGLRIVCHAGEVGGADSVRDAIEVLGAERVGHGIAVMHDPGLIESLITRRVVIENCITSNLCTGALAKQLGRSNVSAKDHPLPKFLGKELLVTLSTDDPALFHTDLLNEYLLAEELGLSRKKILDLAEGSISAAFLPANDKRQLLENFRGAAKAAGLV